MDDDCGGEELPVSVVEGVDVVGGKIQLPRRSKPSGQLFEGVDDDDGGAEELPVLDIEGVDVGVSVVGDNDGDRGADELPVLVVEGVELVVGRIQLPRGSKPSGQLFGGVEDEVDGEEFPELVGEGVDVRVSVVGDEDDEELPELVVGRIQLPRRSKPSGQLFGGGVDDDVGGEELPELVGEDVDVAVSVVGDEDDEELPVLLVGRIQLPRRSKPSGQFVGPEVLVDGEELVDEVSDDGGLVVAEELVDGGLVLVERDEGLVVEEDDASEVEVEARKRLDKKRKR